MKLVRKKGCLFYFLIGLAVFLALYFLVWFPTYSWNQKLTITIETPQGEVSGSSVVDAWFTSQPFDFGAVRNWRGEATVVDLGDGSYLFATLGTPVGLAMAVFGEKAGNCSGKWTCIYRSFKGWFSNAPEQVLTPKHYPLLVTFDDINDPANVKKVDPDNLATSFGPGYSIKSITLEITNERVTTGKVEEVLGWLDEYKGRIKPPSLRLGPGLHPADAVLLIEKLTKSDFIRR